MRPQLFDSLKNYKKKDIFGDLLAGLMVAIIALPLSIALGIQSVPEGVGMGGIQAGIITAIVAGFFISALGGSKFQIGGPTAAFVVIIFGYLSNPDIGVLGLAIAAMMAGVLLIIMGLARVGNVMKFFPYPITIGFTTGIGITLLVGQIKDLCGFEFILKEATRTDVIAKIVYYVQNITTFDLATFGVGALGLVCCIVLPKISKKIPSALVALIVCTGATLLLNNFAGTSVATIGSKYGEIKAGFFPVDFSNIASVKFGALIVPAIVIAFLCAIESLLSATVAAGITGTTFNSNQELIGQGVANICSSLLGGLPATGAIARTAAGIENGAKSPLTGMFHAIFVLILYFLLMNVVKHIPLAVFSAILISVAINMSRFPLFIKLTRFGVRDTLVLIITCVLTVVFDLTYGVLGGVAVTLIANAVNFKKPLKLTLLEEDGAPVINDENGVTVFAEGTLYFINATRLTTYISKQSERSNRVAVDLSKIERIDQTAMEKLAGHSRALKMQNKELILINANEKTQKRIDKFFSVV
ncbi:MAG: SulP family inorganic anion transporter [Clostridia bacterium]|nr:SulP family inorganic anion transporter [Clostridia bacterium]